MNKILKTSVTFFCDDDKIEKGYYIREKDSNNYTTWLFYCSGIVHMWEHHPDWLDHEGNGNRWHYKIKYTSNNSTANHNMCSESPEIEKIYQKCLREQKLERII